VELLLRPDGHDEADKGADGDGGQPVLRQRDHPVDAVARHGDQRVGEDEDGPRARRSVFQIIWTKPATPPLATFSCSPSAGTATLHSAPALSLAWRTSWSAATAMLDARADLPLIWVYQSDQMLCSSRRFLSPTQLAFTKCVVLRYKQCVVSCRVETRSNGRRQLLC
jgi:hypothetical protein